MRDSRENGAGMRDLEPPFQTLRAGTSRKFLLQSQNQEPMKSVLLRDTIQRDYSFPSGCSRWLTPKLNTKKFNDDDDDDELYSCVDVIS